MKILKDVTLRLNRRAKRFYYAVIGSIASALFCSCFRVVYGPAPVYHVPDIHTEQLTITGTVRAKDSGSPLEGIEVLVVHKSVASDITDSTGSYHLKLSESLFEGMQVFLHASDTSKESTSQQKDTVLVVSSQEIAIDGDKIKIVPLELERKE